MPKFTVTLIETLTDRVAVEAPTEVAAMRAAETFLTETDHNDDYLFGASGYKATRTESAADDAQRVGPVDLVGMEAPPDVGHTPHGGVEVIRAAGQRRRVDGTGRRAGDDRKRVGLVQCAAGLADVGDGLEHADLVGGPCAAPRQQQSGFRHSRRFHGHAALWMGPGAVGQTAFR